MSFMQMQIFKKGALYAADCAKCGTTIYSHEWAIGDNNELRDALQNGTAECPDCGGHADPSTFIDCGKQYAGWYSAPGYLDCTSMHYGKNLRNLKREIAA